MSISHLLAKDLDPGVDGWVGLGRGFLLSLSLVGLLFLGSRGFLVALVAGLGACGANHQQGGRQSGRQPQSIECAYHRISSHVTSFCGV